MIVTQSLARGAVRAAAARHSEAAARAYSRLVKSGVSAPVTLRRYGAWFRRHQGIFERDALLIALGWVSRRGGAFCAYSPAFEKSEKGWELGIRKLRIEFVPGDIVAIDEERMPVRVSGHALERMFQRINTIDWPVIRDCLAGATHFICAAGEAYASSDLRQCAIPADRGLLVGQVQDDELTLRTFLPDSQLNLKWQAIYEDLRRFRDENEKAMKQAALVPDPGLRARLRELIASGRHQWLRRAYVPGEDPLEDAWRLRVSSTPDLPPA
jgi:hypothetical protein